MEEEEETYGGVGVVVEKRESEELAREGVIDGEEGREGGECAGLVEDLGLGLRMRAVVGGYEVGGTGLDDGLEEEGGQLIPLQKRSVLHTRLGQPDG